MGRWCVQEPLNSASFVCPTYSHFYQTWSTASIGLRAFSLSEQRYFKAFLKLGLHLGKPEIWFLESEGRGEAARMTWCTPCMGHLFWFPVMTHQACIVSKLIWGPGGHSTSSFEAARHFFRNASCCTLVSFQGYFFCPPPTKCSWTADFPDFHTEFFLTRIPE